MHRKEHSYKSF